MLDVAALAGVSVGTVSNVLNRPHLVAHDTQARVRRAMAKLHFVPNSSARQLRRGRSDAIGVVVFDLSNPFWGEITRGIESVAAESGFVVMLGSSDESPTKERRFLHVLDERRPEGLLVASVQDEEQLVLVRDRGTPVVLLDCLSDTGTLSCVSVDDRRGGELAANHLFEQGHERIGFVNGPTTRRLWGERRRGVQDAARARGLDWTSAVLEITASTSTVRAGEASGEEILKAKRPPTAIFCVNDVVALGMLRKFAALGIAVPDEFAVVGYDDIDFAAVLAPSLTSIRLPAYEVGRTAAQILMHEIENPGPRNPSRVLFEPELIIRESSAARYVHRPVQSQ